MPQLWLRRAVRARCALWGISCVLHAIRPGFRAGGAAIQKERLEAEGVTVTRSEYEYYVDMKKYGYHFGDDL